MPQTSLLSYFPTSMTPVPPGQISTIQKRSDGGLGNVRGAKEIPSLGIVEAIGRELADEGIKLPKGVTNTTPLGGTSAQQALPQENGDSTPGKDLFPFLNPEHSEVYNVPHLSGAVIMPVSEAHLASIKRLTSTTLPVRYGDAFFNTTLTDASVRSICRVVLYASEPVGWIRCRPEPCSPDSKLNQIYIQALALLSPYRGLGLATLLLDRVLSSPTAQAEHTVCIYAHVWEKNEDALDWYGKRGFRRITLVDHYYRKLRPSGAWIVRRELDKG